MMVITVEARFAAGAIETAVGAVAEQADAVRAMVGCESYAFYTNGDALSIIQWWQTMDQFDGYRQGETFAGLIAALKPLMAAPPVTTVAEAATP